MRNVTIILAVAAVVALASPAWSDCIWVNDSGNGLWKYDSGAGDTNWDTDTLPGFGDDVYIGGHGTCTVNNWSCQSKNIYVGTTAEGAGALAITAGDLLAWSAAMYVGYNDDGVFTQSGGTMDIRGTTYVGYNGNTGEFVIDGTGPAATNTRGYVQSSASTLKLILTSGGAVDKITVGAGYTATLDGTLCVDLTNGYTPSLGDPKIAVLTAPDAASLSYGSLVTNDPVHWKLTDDGAGTLQVYYVPEPASMVLLLSGGVLAMLRRRRK